MTWLIILVMAVITFANRYIFFIKNIGFDLGVRTKRLLGYSSYAIMTAIWTPIVFGFDSEAGFSYAGNDYLIAVVIAALMTLLRVPSILVVMVSTAAFFLVRLAF